MAQLLLRNLDDDVKARLRERALRHGRSMEAEVRDILRDVLRDPGTPQQLGTRIAARFSGIGMTEDIAEQRHHEAHPTDLEP